VSTATHYLPGAWVIRAEGGAVLASRSTAFLGAVAAKLHAILADAPVVLDGPDGESLVSPREASAVEDAE
jgi:hypothetical protein